MTVRDLLPGFGQCECDAAQLLDAAVRGDWHEVDRLDGGGDLADVLVAETQQVLDSAMTREQIASALVSVMVRVAHKRLKYVGPLDFTPC